MSSPSVSPLLPSVCLCAIVKNELANPAGGIVAYLDRILPAVHTAVIVDTGSDDGTLEALRARESTERHARAHLHVSETPFVSFADARNDALHKALSVRDQQLREGRTTFKHILVLDADEVLSAPCIEVLAEVLALDRSDPTAQAACLSRQPSASSSSLAQSSPAPAVHPASPPPSSDAPPPLPYPLALKFSCHCYSSSGMASPRSNSGLWNPRLFSADPRFGFINLIDNFRFERLMYEGVEIAPECYLRESDLPHQIRARYEALRAGELRAASGGEAQVAASSSDAAAGAGAAGVPAPASSIPDSGSGGGGDLASAPSCSRSPALLVPMRHFIPSLAGRRKKNAAYKEGGARARAKAAAAEAAAAATAVDAGASGASAGSSSSCRSLV